MNASATLEPLFHATKTGDDLFPGEKYASNISRMPDDPQKWPAHIQSELLRYQPYLSNYDVEIVLDRIEPEAGASLGYAQVRNRTVARPQDDAARAGNVVRIPIIVQDRRLQKFLVFEVGGQVFPLSEERIEQAMLSPSPFDTHAKKMPRSGSLIDQLYPPYQQRQGFGRIVEPGVDGLSKISSAPEKPSRIRRGRAMSATAAGLTGFGVPGLPAAAGALGAQKGRRLRAAMGAQAGQIAGFGVSAATGHHPVGMAAMPAGSALGAYLAHGKDAPQKTEKKAFFSLGGGGISTPGLRLGRRANLSGQVGYSNYMGVLPFPDARVRLGNEDIGGSVGPYTLGIDSGHPQQAHLYYRPGVLGHVLDAKPVDVDLDGKKITKKKRKKTTKKASAGLGIFLRG